MCCWETNRSQRKDKGTTAAGQARLEGLCPPAPGRAPAPRRQGFEDSLANHAMPETQVTTLWFFQTQTQTQTQTQHTAQHNKLHNITQHNSNQPPLSLSLANPFSSTSSPSFTLLALPPPSLPSTPFSVCSSTHVALGRFDVVLCIYPRFSVTKSWRLWQQCMNLKHDGLSCARPF